MVVEEEQINNLNSRQSWIHNNPEFRGICRIQPFVKIIKSALWCKYQLFCMYMWHHAIWAKLHQHEAAFVIFTASSIDVSAWSVPGIQRGCSYIGSKMPAELHFVLRTLVPCFQSTQWITGINILNLHVVIWNRCLLNSTGGVFIIPIFLSWAPLGRQC